MDEIKETETLTEPSNKPKKDKTKDFILIALLAVLIIALCFVLIQLFYKYKLDSYFVKNEHASVTFSYSDDITDALNTFTKSTTERISLLPKIYAIPTNQYVSPEPKKENFNKSYTTYSDETITAKYYKETHYDAVFHFIDVEIAHPSQIRMALAGNKYGEKKLWPQNIAKAVNAVAAVDGSYYNVRNNGVLYYQGNLLRKKAKGWDVLLIDSEGDLHIAKDKAIINGELEGEFEIVNSVTFGPALVLNGEVQPTNTSYGFPADPEPRAAIGQLGKLHYLICTVDGRQDFSIGVTQHELATVLARKKCNIAYNLDGGQSATLILGNRVKNSVAYGGQRKLGDILYFATALTEDE